MFLCIHKTDYAYRKVTKYQKYIFFLHKTNFEKLASDDPRISDSDLSCMNACLLGEMWRAGGEGGWRGRVWGEVGELFIAQAGA